MRARRNPPPEKSEKTLGNCENDEYHASSLRLPVQSAVPAISRMAGADTLTGLSLSLSLSSALRAELLIINADRIELNASSTAVTAR
jgi:hypothetical protein